MPDLYNYAFHPPAPTAQFFSTDSTSQLRLDDPKTHKNEQIKVKTCILLVRGKIFHPINPSSNQSCRKNYTK